MTERDYVEGSGNVFADLGFPDAVDMLAKADLAIKIADILRKRHLTQAKASAILGVDQPKVSALIRGRLTGFSVERLLRFLLLLGADVSITINPHPRFRSRSRVRAPGRSAVSRQTGVLTVVDFVAPQASESHELQQG
jgi:predicted XRE-type DNA-binding protein